MKFFGREGLCINYIFLRTNQRAPDKCLSVESPVVRATAMTTEVALFTPSFAKVCHSPISNKLNDKGEHPRTSKNFASSFVIIFVNVLVI